MGAGEVIVTVVAIIIGGALGFCLIVLAFGDKLLRQDMEDELSKDCVKERDKHIKEKAAEKKAKREAEKNKKKVGYSFDISEEKIDPKKLEGYMEVFPEIPKKKKSSKKKSTK